MTQADGEGETGRAVEPPAGGGMDEGRRRRVGAIDRLVQMLDLLTERGKPMTAYELSRACGAPLSTVYKLAEELTAQGLLSRVGERTLWLGPRLMRYGLTYRAGMDLFAAARREMQALSARVDETVQICARDEGMMTVIAMARGSGHFNVASDVGSRVPLNWTASGRLLLGHLPEAERRAIFAACARPSNTATAETDPDRLAATSGQEFRARLAVQMGASEYAVACIAAPICDEAGHCAATISIVLPESTAQAELARMTAEVQQAAARVEVALGRQGVDRQSTR